jgi:hypothetical protein
MKLGLRGALNVKFPPKLFFLTDGLCWRPLRPSLIKRIGKSKDYERHKNRKR